MVDCQLEMILVNQSREKLEKDNLITPYQTIKEDDRVMYADVTIDSLIS